MFLRGGGRGSLEQRSGDGEEVQHVDEPRRVAPDEQRLVVVVRVRPVVHAERRVMHALDLVLTVKLHLAAQVVKP